VVQINPIKEGPAVHWYGVVLTSVPAAIPSFSRNGYAQSTTRVQSIRIQLLNKTNKRSVSLAYLDHATQRTHQSFLHEPEPRMNKPRASSCEMRVVKESQNTTLGLLHRADRLVYPAHMGGGMAAENHRRTK
jgi:hypothetical protein